MNKVLQNPIKCQNCDTEFEDSGFVCTKCPKCGEVVYNKKRLKDENQ